MYTYAYILYRIKANDASKRCKQTMQANGIAEKEAKTANSKRVRKRTIRAMDGYGDANDQDEKAEYHVNKIKTRARSMRKIKTRALKGRPSTFFIGCKQTMQAHDASKRCTQKMHANNALMWCSDAMCTMH
jgi:hypothetical protein